MVDIKWFVRAQGHICTTESTALVMPVTGIIEAIKPAYVITTVAVADTIAVRVDMDMAVVIISIMVMDVDMDMIVGSLDEVGSRK
jgi:hypothetical protein